MIFNVTINSCSDIDTGMGAAALWVFEKVQPNLLPTIE
jgi:hypothetical protein